MEWEGKEGWMGKVWASGGLSLSNEGGHDQPDAHE
jgi:hypothetical protein